jgi:hypothetical protein
VTVSEVSKIPRKLSVSAVAMSQGTSMFECIFLKGNCHEVFDPRVFHQTIPPRALSNGLNPFRI